MLPDPTTPFGQRVRRRLQDERVVWLTSVGQDGTPQPNPVWFWWDGGSFLVYNRPDAGRVAHVRSRPAVSLSFDGDGRGGDIVVVLGRAELSPGEPPAHDVPEYLAKYREQMVRVSGSAEAFSRSYPTAMRVHPLRVRGH